MPFNYLRKIDLSDGIRDVGILGDLMVVQLRRVDVLLSRAFNVVTDHAELGYGTISSLALIVANPGISQNEISKCTGIDKSAVVPIIDHLERSGWAIRKKSRQDRRRNALHATPEGEARLKSLTEAVKKIEDDMLSGVSESDINMLSNLLDRIFHSCLKHSPPDLCITPDEEVEESPRPRKKVA
jgi:DNA-binding MarR family transcriptional regulator